MNNQYLTPPDVAKILGINRQAVSNWIYAKRLSCHIVGNRYRISPENLLNYLKGLGNNPDVMREFKNDIDEFLNKKYR